MEKLGFFVNFYADITHLIKSSIFKLAGKSTEAGGKNSQCRRAFTFHKQNKKEMYSVNSLKCT